MRKPLLFLSLLATAALAGCDFAAVRDAVDDFDLIIQLEPIETYAVGQVLDAATGDPIPGEVAIHFEGADGGSLVDFYSDPLSSTVVRGGLFTVGIANGTEPSAASPVRVRVVASAAGYEDAASYLTVSAKGEHAFQLSLAPQQGEIDGVVREMMTVNAGPSGVAAFSMATEPEQISGGSASVSVGEGTSFIDAAGNAVDGALTASIAYYSPESDASLSLLPGGFGSSSSNAEDGAGEGSIVTAGFADITATNAAGRRAARLSDDARFSVALAPYAVNPRTGSAYAAGDAIDVFHFDAADGAWSKVAVATVATTVGKQSSGLVANFSSPYAGFQALGSLVETCGSGTEISFDRNGHTGSMAVVVRGEEGGYVRRAVLPAESDRLVLSDLPVGVGLEMEVELPDGASFTLAIADGCSGSESVALPAPLSEPVAVSFTVDLSCTLKLKPPFNATLNYKRAGTRGGGVSAGVPQWVTDEQGRVSGGSLTIPGLYLNQAYRFILVTPETTAGTDVVINIKENIYHVDVPPDLCRR